MGREHHHRFRQLEKLATSDTQEQLRQYDEDRAWFDARVQRARASVAYHREGLERARAHLAALEALPWPYEDPIVWIDDG